MSVEIVVDGAPLTIMDDNQLGIVHDKTKQTSNWILDTFFSNKVSFPNKDAVPLDELETTQALAPFVSPTSQGKVITSNGSFNREYVKAPYLKPADVLTPNNIFDSALLAQLRDVGVISTATGKLTKQDQLRVAQMSKFKQIRSSIDNRKTLMATDILTTGKTLCIGDDHPAYEIDFRRDAQLNYKPASGQEWGTATATPVADIEEMNQRLIDIGGRGASDAVMSSKVFAAMKSSGEFKDKLQKPLGSTAPDIFAPKLNRSDIPQYRGDIDGIRIWTYDVAHSLLGAPQRFIDATGFYLIADTQGYQAQCEIKHGEAWGQALEYFDYQVVDRDPWGVKMITDSSPLILPSNVNGVCGGTGFVA